jgi:hypothetical protein
LDPDPNCPKVPGQIGSGSKYPTLVRTLTQKLCMLDGVLWCPDPKLVGKSICMHEGFVHSWHMHNCSCMMYVSSPTPKNDVGEKVVNPKIDNLISTVHQYT